MSKRRSSTPPWGFTRRPTSCRHWSPHPPYTPTRVGARPPKPRNLRVSSKARPSSDGSIHFRITASVEDHPLRKVWRLQAGDDVWETTTESATHVFAVNVPRQEMEVRVRHIDAYGVVSLPVRVIFTPGYDALIFPTPRWSDVEQNGSALRLTWAAEQFTTAVSGGRSSLYPSRYRHDRRVAHADRRDVGVRRRAAGDFPPCRSSGGKGFKARPSYRRAAAITCSLASSRMFPARRRYGGRSRLRGQSQST